MLTIDIITLFPSMFSGPFDKSIIKRAQEQNLVKINIHNLRDWAIDARGTVDDRPYGGGKGMILRPEPIFAAVEEIVGAGSPRPKNGSGNPIPTIILLTPQGKLFNQKEAQRLSKLKHLILICGHYEGVDERVREHLVDKELSIGDYILSGGETPAMVVTDAIVRLIPGVLDSEATTDESFSKQIKTRRDAINRASTFIEYSQYTRPPDFRGLKVPEILLSGNHEEIKKWQKRKAVERTKRRRPDLLKHPSDAQKD